MKDLPPPRDPVEAMGETYELLLEKTLQDAHQEGNSLHDMADTVRKNLAALNKFSEEELTSFEGWVKRDLINAAWYLQETGKALGDWLGFDLSLIKNEFWELFAAAADKTTTELSQMKLQAENAEYHTGEITGLGTLACDQCGETLHFHKPGRIPPCPKCKGTHFHRQNFL